MHELELKLLSRLVFAPDKLPRNRNFETFEKPRFRRIRRRAAHLRSLIEELSGAEAESVRFRLRGEDEIEVLIRGESGAKRMSLIPVDEYRVLLGMATLRDRLVVTLQGPDLDPIEVGDSEEELVEELDVRVRGS